jgi:hypothetical protein
MSNFYIDSVGGSDANAGTTPAAPWVSLAPLVSRLATRVIDRGDTVLFKRGSTFYGPLTGFVSSPAGSPHLVFGAYGVGSAPEFVGYKLCNSAAAWTLHEGDVWKIDLAAGSGAHTGNVAAPGSNIGHLLVDGAIKGVLRASIADLTGQWNFYTDPATSILYVRTGANPTTLAASIGAAPKQNGLEPQSSMTVTDLAFKGFGLHGWRIGGTSTRVGDVHLARNSFVNVGGSNIGSGPRAGNGGEVWIGGFDILTERNRYEGAYDTAYTLQGAVDGAADRWENVIQRYDTIVGCNQSIEFWAQGVAPSGGFKNVKSYGNLCINAGYSWGDVVRPDTDGKATHLLTYDITLPTDIEVFGNIFFGAKENYRYHRQGAAGSYTYDVPAGYNVHDNYVFADAGVLVSFGKAQSISEADAWVAANASDKGSTFSVTPTGVVAAAVGEHDGAYAKIVQFLASHGAAAKAVAALAFRSGATVAPCDLPASRGPMISGNWYSPEKGALGAYQTANQAAGAVWEAPNSGVVDRIAIDVTTAGSATAVVRAAIYRLRAGGGADLVLDFGTVAAATTGVKEFPGSVRVREGDRFWLAVAIQGAPTTVPILRAASSTGRSDPNVSSNNLAFILQNAVNGFTLSGVSATFPAVVAVMGATTNTPVVVARAL